MVLVRILSQSDYGTYQQMILISSVAIGLMTLGLPTSIYYFYNNVPTDRISALIVQTSVMLGIAGAIATATIVLAATSIADGMNNVSMGSLLQIYAISIAFMIASEHSVHFMIAQGKYKLSVAFEIGETFIRVLVLLAPLWLGYGFIGLIGGIVAYAILRFFVRMTYLFYRSGVNYTGWSRFLFPMDQLGYSIPIALGSLVSLTGGTINRGVLATSVTPAQYAIYSVGALEIPLDVIFQSSVANVLRASLPPLVRDGNLKEVVRIIREAVRKLSIIVLPSFVFLFGYSHEFITLLFTSRYEESVEIFRIYLWLVPLHMFILSPIPHVFGKTRVNLYIILLVSTTLIFLSYPMFKWFGLYGPALASVITQYLGVILYFVVTLRLLNTTLVRLLPFPNLLRGVLASLGGLLLAKLLLHDLTSPGLLNLVLAGMIFSVGYLVLAAIIGVFTPEDRRLLRRWIAKVLPIRSA